jgi:ParB-like chromosome segregation protein Spo0J
MPKRQDEADRAPIRQYVDRMTTATIPIELIDAHPDNYNFHPQVQIADLKKSYQRRGQFRTMLVWARPGGRYTIVAGEGFTGGAHLGGASSIRCEVLPEDTPPEYVEEILLADNLHGRNSVAEEDILLRLLRDQDDLGVELESLGSSNAEVEELTLLLEATEAHEVDDEDADREASSSRRPPSVGVLVAVSSLAVIEEALALTQERTRGAALETICTWYVEQRSDYGTD